MHFMRMECVRIMELIAVMELIILIMLFLLAPAICDLIHAKADEIRAKARRMLEESDDDDDNS